ncbi:MAG: tRNA 2-selenouridine(34) synthase MnmH [Halioglobus sp.]
MAHRADSDDYRSLLLTDTPMMDMRAPTEFSHGAFPSAHSLPLMSDIERAKVGTCYKKQGQQAAIELGHQLVAGDERARRVEAWAKFARKYPEGYLYCFRGGLRSQTVQQWLRDEGIDYPLINGGYKAMRQFLLQELERSAASADIVLIAGKTGTGKTRVISQLSAAVDLEGLAHHRGSTFGQLLEPQPSQIDFENTLSIALMKLLAGDGKRLFLEDEGHLIGRCALPLVLSAQMKKAPMMVVEQSLAERIAVVIDDYVIDLGARFQAAYGEQGPEKHQTKLSEDLYKIRKRLGGARHQEVAAMLDDAFELQRQAGDVSGHEQWISALLSSYYDPMYEYQLAKRAGDALFTGTADEVVARAAGMS